jgi:hypothetical protein
MSAPGITTRDYEKKAVQAFTAATAPRAAEYGPFPAMVEGITYLSNGESNDAFPSGWVPVGSSASSAQVLSPVLLPYGSQDPSVIWQHPLTTVPTAADLGYTTRAFLGDPGGPTTDPIKGMQLNRAGVSAAVAYSGPNANLIGWAEKLRLGGQVRFEVESAYIGAGSGDLAGFTGGYIPAAAEVLFSLRQNAAGQPVRLDKATSGSFSGSAGNAGSLTTHNFGISVVNTYDMLFTHGVSTPGGTSRYHHGLEQFTEVAIAWEGDVGSKGYFFIDGIPTGIFTLANTMGNMLENLIFGAVTILGSTQVGTGAVHFLRNFQLAAKKPNFSVNPVTQKIAVLSDSILGIGPSQAGTGLPTATGFRQQNLREQLLKHLARGGCWFESYYQCSMGGHTATQGVNGTQDFYSTTELGVSGRQRVRTYGPTTLICHASNDFGVGVTPSQYIDTWKDHLDYFFGLGAYSGQVSSAPRLVVMTTVNDRTAANNWDATERSNVQAANALLRTFVGVGGTYDQLRPGYGKRLVLADLYSATNGVTAFTGKLNADGIHPDWLANRKIGQEIGTAIVSAVAAGGL